MNDFFTDGLLSFDDWSDLTNSADFNAYQDYVTNYYINN